MLNEDQVTAYVAKKLPDVTTISILPRDDSGPLKLLSELEGFSFQRKRFLINYQQHWFMMDVQCNPDTQRLSIILFDAANTTLKLSAFAALLMQFDIPFDIYVYASELPLQKSVTGCAVFAIEHAKFSLEHHILHDQTAALWNKAHHTDLRNLSVRKICLSEFYKGFSSDYKKVIMNGMNQIKWIHYDSLHENPEYWRGFFVNSQHIENLNHYTDIVSTFVRSAQNPQGRPTVHNTRINQCYEDILLEINTDRAIEQCSNHLPGQSMFLSTGSDEKSDPTPSENFAPEP